MATNRIYPKTLASSVSYNNGYTTVEDMLDNGIYVGDENSSIQPLDPVNADTLEGYPAKAFAKSDDLSDLTTHHITSINNINQSLTILETRVDSLASLEDGSTTGDAELLDIRVKMDGTSSSTAGNAIREQLIELKNEIKSLKNAIIALGGTVT